eukprot:322391-Rhodomonas_salina.1
MRLASAMRVPSFVGMSHTTACCGALIATKAATFRQLSTPAFRASPMKTAGRNGTYGRIRPAVGDQRGGLTESSTKENDSDWIKIQQYVTTLNPRILGEAQDALNRKKWKGEGVAQQAFETSCVSDMAALSVMCSSEDVVASVAHALSAMADSGLQPVEDGKTHLIIEGLAIRVEQMPGW